MRVRSLRKRVHEKTELDENRSRGAAFADSDAVLVAE